MPGVPKSRGCEACRKVRKKVSGHWHWRQLWSGLGLEVPYADLTCDLTCSVTRPVLHVRGAPASKLPVKELVSSASFSWMRLFQKTRHVALPKIAVSWEGRQIR
jgi:hypothetical protein